MAKRKTYHHGDLANALLHAALALIEENGLEGLSLRKVAARVGVSHAAPEHHFPTLKHLLTAMATVGFNRFTEAMQGQRAIAPAMPEAQMRAAGCGYLAFARENPALFRLMSTESMLDWSDAALCEAAMASRNELADICAPAAERLGLSSDAGRQALENLVWSQIHGRAFLEIDLKLPPTKFDTLPEPAVDIAWLIFGANRTA